MQLRGKGRKTSKRPRVGVFWGREKQKANSILGKGRVTKNPHLGVRTPFTLKGALLAVNWKRGWDLGEKQLVHINAEKRGGGETQRDTWNSPRVGAKGGTPVA